jgi:hypothetical protein
MKITVAYIVKKLIKDYGYENMSDVLKIVDEKLKTHKNISIKK